jgi:hypothetical protein
MKYGQEDGIFREPAQVMMHLPENWTKILLVRTYGLGLAFGGAYWDIPTGVIPFHLRKMGSRFVVSVEISPVGNRKEYGDEWVESHGRRYRIQELPEEDKDLWQECNRT